MPSKKPLFLLLIVFLFTGITHADKAFTERREVQRFIQNMVQKHGFQAKELNALMQQVVIQPQIIESMNKPYEKKPWDVYKQIFLTNERVEAGIAFWRANQKTLRLAEARFGVPADIIVAILGVETLYGKKQGEYRVLDALSTLAFNYPARAPYFKRELVEFLLLCREHKVSPTQYVGSYAGAMGKPQFMPSSYRSYATDFSNQPIKDLMHNDEAAIASIANYFHKHGWKPYQGVALEASVAGKGYKHIHTRYRNAVYTKTELKEAGIKPIHTPMPPAKKLGFIKLTSLNNSEYWVTYPNFYVITRYNTSPQYAMAVYLLSLELKKEWG